MGEFKRVVTSLYGDPFHVGHLKCLESASMLGHLTVILNSDEQCIKKKGFIFMPWIERQEIIKAIRYVDRVIMAIDYDLTVRKTLRLLATIKKIDYFFKDGDRDSLDKIPEAEVCKEFGIQIVFGGNKKIQSSSLLIERIKYAKRSI